MTYDEILNLEVGDIFLYGGQHFMITLTEIRNSSLYLGYVLVETGFEYSASEIEPKDYPSWQLSYVEVDNFSKVIQTPINNVARLKFGEI
jgi:hypothetical protein